MTYGLDEPLGEQPVRKFTPSVSRADACANCGEPERKHTWLAKRCPEGGIVSNSAPRSVYEAEGFKFPTTAPDILKRAAKHMEDRAAARDQPGGERSMKRTVDAFNALTGHALSERDGWMFMAVLKAARACNTPTGLADDYEDGAAYFGLAGEAAQR